MQVGISEAIRLLYIYSGTKSAKNYSISSASAISQSETSVKFNQWLAGLIDGDGGFYLSKKGYGCLEITMDSRDVACLYKIKNKFGGSIKLRSGANAVRYRLHDKKGLTFLLNSVNGEIRHPSRILDFGSLLEKFDISLIMPCPLKANNSWLAGFIDADGSVYLDLSSSQIFISLTQKASFGPLLDNVKRLMGGEVYPNVKTKSYKWSIWNKKDIENFLFNYNNEHPCYSKKQARLLLISKYLELRKEKAHLASPLSIKGISWSRFLKSWESYE